MASTFREVLEFFNQLGIFDVILPFLLVFTIMFAIFEKTKVLGTEKIEGKTYSRKNLNAMLSFVIAFLVVASSKLVEIITQVSSQVVVLLLLSVFFLLLVGSFHKESPEGVFLDGAWKKLFMIIMFIGIVAIFLYAIKTKDGEPWLEWFIKYVVNNFSSAAVASIILIVVLILAMWFIVRDPKSQAAESK